MKTFIEKLSETMKKQDKELIVKEENTIENTVEEISYEDSLKGKDYLEQKKLAEQEIERIENNALVAKDIIYAPQNEGENRLLHIMENAVDLALDANVRVRKVEAKMAIYDQDLEERKNLCNDSEIQAINDKINSCVQKVLNKLGLNGAKGEYRYRKAIYNILKGKLKKTYHIRFWAQNNTKIKKSSYEDIMLSIPEFANEIKISAVTKRAENYKESENERNERDDKKAINRMKTDGRAIEALDGTIVIKNVK